MRKDSFEQSYWHLADTDDWTKVFGPTVHPGIWTVGDIRRRLEAHPPHALVHLEIDGTDFLILDYEAKFFVS